MLLFEPLPFLNISIVVNVYLYCPALTDRLYMPNIVGTAVRPSCHTAFVSPKKHGPFLSPIPTI